MKVTAMQSNLAPAIAAVSHAINQRASLPILENVYLRAFDGWLILYATDLEKGIEVKVPAKIDDPGEAITVNAKAFRAFVDSAPKDGIVTITADGQDVGLVAGDFRRGLRGIDADEYPSLITNIGLDHVVELDAQTLRQAIAQVLPSIAHDTARPILTGAMITSSGNGTVRIVSANNYSITVRTMETYNNAVTGEYIVPWKTLVEIARAIGKTKGRVELRFGDKGTVIAFIVGETRITTSTIDGSYPNWQQVMPIDGNTKVNVDTKPLQAAIKAAHEASASGVVKMDVGATRLLITARDYDQNEAFSASVEATVEGDPTSWAFDGRHLVDVARLGERIEVWLNGPLSPGTFIGEDVRLVAMPTRTTS